MKFLPLRLLACALLAHVAHAQSPLTLTAPGALKTLGANWQSASALGGDPRHDKILTGLPGSGLLVNNPTKQARAHLVTAWDHADVELELDFLLTAGSNSGVYLMGRYEVQLFDSWGQTAATKPSDCGGIYDRWDAARGQGNESYDGTAPRAHAARAPGLWQHLRIEFRAPRFDAAGKKIANAKFLRVFLNGYLIHENVEISGPTRSALFETEPEAPRGPLMIQGDHGTLAVRALSAQLLDSPALTTSGLTYELYVGPQKGIADYVATPTESGPLPNLSVAPIQKSGKGALVIKGTLHVGRADTYTFSAETRNPARLIIDDQLAISPLELGADGRTVTLTAGTHPFRLDYQHVRAARAALAIGVRGIGLPAQSFTYVDPTAKPKIAPSIPLAPGDRPRLQRGFVPYEPKKRLYAISVGSPTGAHFAYDFETGSLLRVWRGSFIDVADMWESRGESQLAQPSGPALTLNHKPTVALLESFAHDWPDAPEPLWSSQGYTLAPDGTPTFLGKLAQLDVRDTLVPGADGRSLTRTLVFNGRNTSWETYVLVAEADVITAQPGGNGWIIGDRTYYIDLPKGGPLHPTVRTRNGRQQLVVPLSGGKVDRTLTYTLVW